MCENGINVDQLKESIAHVSESLGMSQQWLGQLHHTAEHGRKDEAGAELATAMDQVARAREGLERALVALDNASPGADVTVELV